MRLRQALLFLMITLLSLNDSFAQKESETPKKVTVISETKDAKGYVTRIVEYYENGFRIRKTITLPPMPSFSDRKFYRTDTMNMDSMLVYVDKTNYTVALIYKRERIRQYRAVFGPDRLRDKLREGDKCTPEGWFKVTAVRDNSNWGKFIQINYPNEESFKKYNDAKIKGIIPNSASIGHSVGIHGTFPNGEGMVEMGLGWTDGCVSLTTKDIMDFYKFIKPGVRVYIKK
ncbi:MAG TPA: L,D-transpeptidase [Edaphocola sp.]|nr:L,D-transpeptidase [Edaphocola sp.]